MEEQISRAKEMLLSQDSTKKEEAVRVLIGISKQGNNKEATDILTKCLEEREGITPENQDDVKWCVKTSEEEKRLRHAVEELYNSMKNDGEDKVAVQDIDEAMKRAEAKLKEKEKDNSSEESEEKKQQKEMREELGLMSLLINALTVGKQDQFTVTELKDTVMAYARGDVPEVITVLNKEDMEKFKKASVLEKIMKYPEQSLESAKHFILVKISKEGSSFLKSLIPTSQIQMLFLLYIYSQLTADFLWFLAPLIIFYISFLSLVVFSLQMFYGREALRQLKGVSELMKKFDPRLNSKEAERKFMWKSITPYISFFIVLLITVAVFPLCEKHWIPCSELSLVALFFTVSSFRGLPDKYDNYALYTILLKLLTTALCSLGNVRGLAFLCYPIFRVPLRPCGLELDISLPSLLHVTIFGLLILIAGRHSWRGIYKVLIPHLVCLLWWQLFTELFHFTTWSSLLRATVGWVIFVTMLPMLFLFTIGVVLAHFLQWFMTLDLAFKLAVTAAIIAISSALFYYSKLEIPHGDKLERKKKPLMIIAGLVVLCLLVPIIYVNFAPSIYGAHRPLSWDEYNDTCVSKANGGDINIAAVQITCNEFQGEPVNWTGTVAYVKLSSVENRFRRLVTCLPRFLQPALKCLLGGEENNSTDRPPETSSWLSRPKGSCHLRSFDRYTFSVGVKMTDAASQNSEIVKVTVTHRFYHTIVTLQENTQFTFQGRIESGPPFVTVTAKRLFINGAKVKPNIGFGRDDIFEGLRDCGRFMAQFFMTPLINERDEEDDND